MIVVTTFALNAVFNFAVGLLVAKFLGPAEFGRFALGLAIAGFLNTAAFDWIRLSATRFYAERTRRERPQVRATLDAVFAVVTVAVSTIALLLLVGGVRLHLSPTLVGLSVAAGVANGLFDYHTAIIRARFLDRTYGLLIMTKNVCAVLFTVGGAWWFGSATFALVGWCLSVAAALGVASRELVDPGATRRAASAPLARDFARYGVPIITAMVLYQLIPLANRTLTAHLYGFAETGQFSLAFDIGVRIVSTIGSTLDVLLFQIAVKYDETHGPQRAREQVAHNMTVVFAIVLPACVGVWLALPSFEAIVVPAQFRGPFAHYLRLLLPGLCAYGLIQYAVNPMFQIVKRTMPLIAAAVVACIVDATLVVALPRAADATNLAIAQSAALVAGLIALLAIAAFFKPIWPQPRDIAATLVSTAAMAGVLLPFQRMPPGAGTLAIQVVLGTAVVLAFIMAFDLAGLRRMAAGWLRARRLART